MCPDIKKEPADFRMKDNYQGQHPYPDKQPYNGAEQLHIECPDDYPEKVNYKKTDNNIKSHCPFDQPVYQEQEQGNQQNVKNIKKMKADKR
jgi:hypothetical protein